MRSILLVGFTLFFVNSTLFAGVKKEVNIDEFLTELKTIQKQLNVNKVPEKNIDQDIQIINKQIQYKNSMANSKNDDIISKKINNSISFLDNYLSVLNKKIEQEKHIYSDSYYKISNIKYIKVDKNEIDTIAKKIYKEKLEIIKIEKLQSLLKSFKSLGKNVLLSNQITLVMNDMTQITNTSQSNFNNVVVGSNQNKNFNFCSLNKKCFSFKVLSIKPNEIVLDF